MRDLAMWQYLIPVKIKKRLIQVAICLLALFVLSHEASLSPTSRRNPPKQKKKKLCCDLGIAYLSGPGKVVLDQVCAHPRHSTFHFRTVKLGGTCTHPAATILKDQRNRKYKMLHHTGLPPCASGRLQLEANTHFSWSFEPLKKGITSISIIEENAPVTSGMGHWAWRNVEIKHCKFK